MKYTVLLIEDNQEMAENICSILKLAQWKSRGTNSPAGKTRFNSM
jgi:hypothetical protein